MIRKKEREEVKRWRRIGSTNSVRMEHERSGVFIVGSRDIWGDYRENKDRTGYRSPPSLILVVFYVKLRYARLTSIRRYRAGIQ